MINLLRRVPPPLWLAGMAISGFMLLLSALPYVQFDRVEVPAPQPPAAVKYPCLSQEPPVHRHLLPVKPKDPRHVVPGAAYKESKGAFGTSAVPENMESLSSAQQFDTAFQTFIDRTCGIDGLYGGSPTLHKVGLLAHHPEVPLDHHKWASWDDRARDLDAYLASIDKNQSFVIKTTKPKNAWTLTAQVQPGTDEPRVVAVQKQQPESWYLVLAVIRYDGTVFYDWRRMECDFPPTYLREADVPPGVPRLR